MNRLTVEEAYTGAVIDTIDLTEWAEIDAALARAETLHRDRAHWLPAWQRVEILEKLSVLITRDRDDLAMLIAREGGKPLTDAIIEADRAASTVRACAAEIAATHGQEMPMDLSKAGSGRIGFTQKEPIGPVAAICAFNHPLNLIAHQVAPAIATGCPVIVKPAPTTPLSCLRFVDLAYEAGLPRDWVKAVVTDNAVAERLVTDKRIAFLTFIGSDKVGWSLRSKLAPGTRCALEHGGAAPVIVDKDADLDAVIPSVVKGGYYHAGQVCVSVQRIFVHEDAYTAFRNKLVEAVERLKTGDPTDMATEVGPLILPREVARVDEWVQEAVEAGAVIATGGKPVSERVYAPTILENPPVDARVSTHEIFGPVTCLYTYSDSQKAVEQANNVEVAFQAAVYTASLDRGLEISRGLRASAVMINDHSAFRVDWMPFAGLGRSGLGVGGVKYTMEDMMIEKLTVIKSPVI